MDMRPSLDIDTIYFDNQENPILQTIALTQKSVSVIRIEYVYVSLRSYVHGYRFLTEVVAETNQSERYGHFYIRCK